MLGLFIKAKKNDKIDFLDFLDFFTKICLNISKENDSLNTYVH